jgi:FtsH-binding integral membrane protein
MGLIWATLVTILMVVALWLTRAAGNIAPVLIPIVAYLAFVFWVDRIK